MHRLTAYATKEGTTEAQANSLCYRGNRHRLTAYATKEGTTEAQANSLCYRGNRHRLTAYATRNTLKGEFNYEQT